MAIGAISPSPKFTGLADNGDPLVGGHLYIYLSGTQTPANTWFDSSLNVLNPFPIILDSGGRATIYLGALTYDFVLKDVNDALIWSQPNIAAVASGGGGGGGNILGEVFVFGGTAPSPVTTTDYPAGSTVDKLHAGTAIFELESGDIVDQTFSLECMMMSDGVAVVTAAIVNLTDGNPDTPLATCSTDLVEGAIVQSGVISFALPGLLKRYGIKTKVSEGAGWVWGCRIVRVT